MRRTSPQHRSGREPPPYLLTLLTVHSHPLLLDPCAQVFGAGNFAGSGVEDSAFIQELEAAYSAAVSREGDCKLAEALLNKEEVGQADRQTDCVSTPACMCMLHCSISCCA